MTATIDRFLDRFTMYRLVLNYLIVLAGAAFVLAFAGVVPLDPTAMAFTGVLTLLVCWATNRLFAWVYRVPANSESVYITVLILLLIIEPVTAGDKAGVGAVIFASVWAMASKYVFAIDRKHLFNPAAFGVAASALLLNQPATWWIGGNLAMAPLVIVGGLLLVRKLHRSGLVVVFMIAALATTLVPADPANYGMILSETLRSSPIFFFAFVMLTEPLTAPTTRTLRLAFAALVGFLYAPDIHVGSFYLTPELALLIGNVFAWAVSPKGRLVLTLEAIEKQAVDTYDFIFRAPRKLAFRAGQYLEWTLPLEHADNRGNRRYFTVASAPTEDSVRLGVKFYRDSSAFKRQLAAMRPGHTIHAAQLAGDFTLPARRDAKLAFVAGGIGITPFRSMLQYLIDRGEQRPITVLYATETQTDIAYADVLDAARRELGIRTFHAVARDAGPGQYPGYIDERMVRAAVPDFRERTFYVSGPQAMVKALRGMLQHMGVPRSRIKVDYFPGFS